MKRRGFVSMLAGLPVIGKVFGKPDLKAGSAYEVVERGKSFENLDMGICYKITEKGQLSVEQIRAMIKHPGDPPFWVIERNGEATETTRFYFKKGRQIYPSRELEQRVFEFHFTGKQVEEIHKQSVHSLPSTTEHGVVCVKDASGYEVYFPGGQMVARSFDMCGHDALVRVTAKLYPLIR